MRSGAPSPRSAPTATGKNARYDAMIATDSHCGHGGPPRAICVPIALTTGAKAIRGTVWLTTIQGSRPHSARRQRCITMPSSIPTATPMTQPTAAIPRVRAAALTTETMSGGVSPPLVDWNSRANISQMCGIARSLVRGRSRKPDPVSPAVAPTEHALGGAEELVRLPDRPRRAGCRRHPRRPPTAACPRACEPGEPGARRRQSSSGQAFAVRWSLSAGMTVSP